MTYATDNRGRKIRNWRVSKEANAPDKYHTPGFARVEKMFYYYPKILQALAEMDEENAIYISCHRDGNGSSNRTFVSDPTYQKAAKRLEETDVVIIKAEGRDDDKIEHPWQWVTVVEQTLARFDKDVIGIVLRKRYLSNEPMAKTCIRAELTYSGYYRARDTGINFARECAIQLGLIRVF